MKMWLFKEKSNLECYFLHWNLFINEEGISQLLFLIKNQYPTYTNLFRQCLEQKS